MSQFIKTVNRLEPAWPNFKNVNNDQVSLVYDVAAPGTDLQNAGYGMAGLRGLGTTGSQFFDDVLAGHFSNLPSDVINQFSPGVPLDYGLIALLVGGAFLFTDFSPFVNRRAKRIVSLRKARLKGNIAKEQALLAGS